MTQDQPPNAASVFVHTSILCGLGNDDEKGFDEAFVRFVERHYLHMSSWFRRFGHNREQDLEDAVQDFFLSIRRKLRSERSREVLKAFAEDGNGGKEKFRKWLWRIAKNASIDFLRSRKSKSDLLFDSESVGANFEEGLSAEIELILRDDFEAILGQIGRRVVGLSIGNSERVGPNDWEVYKQRFIFEKEELADQFGKTTRAIEQSIYRVSKGLKTIRSELVEQYGVMTRFIIHEPDHRANQASSEPSN